MARRFIISLTAVSTLFFGGAAAAGIASEAQKAGGSVGSVTLVLGQATLIPAHGAAYTVQRGVTVKPGDRIETAQGGHVHIRFIDDALVSIRPSSRLIIEEYQYNPERVVDSQVRFKLEAGVARAISGAAAEGAKERFRLNTPLVAIGVRGTDFVVNSQSDQTTAHVNQGAIVMAPLGGECQANTLGPCNTNAAMLVSAKMGNVLAEYRSGLSQPEIKPYLVRSTYFAVASEAGAQPTQAGTHPGKMDAPGAKQEGGAVQVSSIVGNDLVSAVVGGQIKAPKPAMAWGHWSQPEGAGDFSEPFRVAAVDREVTVGNKTHVLYRSTSADAELNRFQPSLGEVGFQLKQSSAQYRPWGGVNQDAVTESGALSINFAAREYQTSLQLNHASAGSHTLSSKGAVLPDGMFGGASGNQKVIGATTFDGKNAGYMFEKEVATGVFNGITLWAR